LILIIVTTSSYTVKSLEIQFAASVFKINFVACVLRIHFVAYVFKIQFVACEATMQAQIDI